jgi:glycosyltransferase involved in cell wall biosynthesis
MLFPSVAASFIDCRFPSLAEEWVKRTVHSLVRRKGECNDSPMRNRILSSSAMAAEGDAAAIAARSATSEEGARRSTPRRAPRALIVSHPAVVSVNQEVYRELRARGWGLTIVLPSRWRHPFASGPVSPQAIAGLEDVLRPTPVALPGRAQRHFYLAAARSLARRAQPDVAFIEAEPFSLAASQWGRALKALGVPFGVQVAENIDRRLPAPVRWQRGRVLRDAAFVAARSETAAELARRWGARGAVSLAPHAVPGWEAPAAATRPDRPFTIGFAGRLVESKGLLDLLAAVRLLAAPVELLLIGDGELRGRLENQEIPGSRVRVLDGVAHADMASAYARMDVLALPSRTTPTWKEQFGRVIVEALFCGLPVVGSDSGEIPWLISVTGGGIVFPEGDARALAAALEGLRARPQERSRLADTGRAAVERMFTLPAATDALEQLLRGALRDQARADVT